MSDESVRKYTEAFQAVVSTTEKLWMELLAQELIKRFGEQVSKNELHDFLNNLPFGSVPVPTEDFTGMESVEQTPQQAPQDAVAEEEDSSLSMEERLLRRWKQ